MKRKLLLKLLLLIFISGYQSAEAQLFKKKKKDTEKEAEKPSKDKIQPYAKVITKEAITDDGLFKVHSSRTSIILKSQIRY